MSDAPLILFVTSDDDDKEEKDEEEDDDSDDEGTDCEVLTEDREDDENPLNA